MTSSITNARSKILHGKASGHTLGEDYAHHLDHLVYRTGSVATASPSLLPNTTVWSGVRMIEKLNTYKPPYGGYASGFGAGNTSTYSQVVRMVFVHGNTTPSPRPNDYHPEPPTCPGNRPSWANHRPGQTTFWQLTYYAPNLGAVHEETWFDERYCAGTASVAKLGYRAFITYSYTW